MSGRDKPDVTLFADASISREKRSGGYGFWAKGDGRDALSGGGPISEFEQSTTAELEALANALTRVSDAGYFRPDDRLVMLQSDSIACLAILRKARRSIQCARHSEGLAVGARKKPIRARDKPATTQILKILDQHSLTAVVRHIKGHSEGGGRNWVNQLCDRIANNNRRTIERARRRQQAEGAGADK